MTQKMDHIAYCAQTKQDRNQIKRFFGLEGADWITDRVTATVDVLHRGRWIKGAHLVMELEFNYDLGNELELVTYVDGPHLHLDDVNNGRTCFFSHHGIHLSADEPWPDERLFGKLVDSADLAPVAYPIIQENWTLSHMNPRLVEKGRTYHYRYYGTHNQFGDHIEYIKRLTGRD
jgi:hypothetical protein